MSTVASSVAGGLPDSGRTSSRGALVLLGILCVVPLILGEFGITIFRRECAEPKDEHGQALVLTGPPPPPAWFSIAKPPDNLLYALHALAATVLRTAQCDPRAVGLHWLRGAYHAQTAAELDEASDGVARAAQSFGSAPRLGDTLCPYVSTDLTGVRQRVLADRVGLNCAARP